MSDCRKVLLPQAHSSDYEIRHLQTQPVTSSLQGEGKVFPMLNYAPRHEDVWRSEGITPRTLNLGTSWRRVVSFTPGTPGTTGQETE
jgi:hypothetical protein